MHIGAEWFFTVTYEIWNNVKPSFTLMWWRVSALDWNQPMFSLKPVVTKIGALVPSSKFLEGTYGERCLNIREFIIRL